MLDPIVALRDKPGALFLVASFYSASINANLLSADNEFVIFECGPECRLNLVRDRKTNSFHAFKSYGHTDGGGNPRLRWPRKPVRAIAGLEERMDPTGVLDGLDPNTPILRHRAIAAINGLHKQAGLPSISYVRGRSKDENFVVHHPEGDTRRDSVPDLAVRRESGHDKHHDFQNRRRDILCPLPFRRLTSLEANGGALTRLLTTINTFTSARFRVATEEFQRQPGCSALPTSHTGSTFFTIDSEAQCQVVSEVCTGAEADNLHVRFNNEGGGVNVQRLMLWISLLVWLASFMEKCGNLLYNLLFPSDLSVRRASRARSIAQPHHHLRGPPFVPGLNGAPGI